MFNFKITTLGTTISVLLALSVVAVVTASIVTVRGIGVWTAQMYLMFRLHRPDVWPIGDLAVRAGYAKVHELAEYPTAKQLDPLGDVYGPWRSAAAWYCYRVLETELS